MKLKLKIITTICLVMILGSCKKYLNQQPITEVGPELVFTDVASTYKALSSAYSRLVGDAGFGIRLSLYYTVDNDEMQGPTGAGDNDRRDIARYSATAGNAQLNAPFNQLFQGIEFSNICIDNIPKMSMYSGGTDQQKQQLQRMYGEALTLRAQYYFEAIVNWGDLPSHFKPAYALAADAPLPGRTNRDSLYDVMLNDLKLAATLVPWRNDLASIGDPIDERITKGTVKGLRARIALFRGGYSLRQTGGMQRSADYLRYYQIARDECNDIITSGQHSLNPSFKSLWRDQVGAHVIADPNGELMFQASAIGLSAAEDTKLGYYDGPRVNGNGNSSINPLPTYFYLFDSTDLRRDVTIAPYNVNLDGVTKTGLSLTTINDGKYRRDWITPAVSPTNAVQYLGTKWQILRYSDVLLMFAEAENEINNGPTTAAYNAINLVRRRGFGKSLSAADATVDIAAGQSKDAFFKLIIKERSLELGGEGVRKFDLIRWNLLASAINDAKTNLTNMANATGKPTYSYMAGSPVYVDNTILPSAMYYFTTSTADDRNLWFNSFYAPSPFQDATITYNTQSGNYTLLANDFGVVAKGTTITITLPLSTPANAGKVYWVKASPNNPAATATASWTYSIKVNTAGGQTYDGGPSNSSVYSGTVAAAGAGNPPTVSGPTSIRGFYSTGSGWLTLTGVSWVTNAISAAGTTSPLSRFATGFVTGKSELLPIPQQARDANINLTQNPGY